jgi:hypothetical protein
VGSWAEIARDSAFTLKREEVDCFDLTFAKPVNAENRADEALSEKPLQMSISSFV